MLPVDAAARPPVPPTPSTQGPALTPAEQQALAQLYAPILYFHPDEQHFLQDPNTFIEQSTLRQERDWRGDKELHGLGDVPAGDLPDIGPGNADADAQVFLDHREEDLGRDIRAGDLDNSRNLYQYDADTSTLTYFFFYAYNDGPPGIGDVQNHEGDWERMTIQFDDRGQPVEVRYGAHNGLDVSRSWAEATKEGGRPVVYVGQGSHASLPEPGRWSTNAPGVDDVASADGLRFDLAERPAANVVDEAYYGSHVLWGERGSAQEFGIGDTSGPTGPSPEKGPILDADPRQPK